MLSEERHKLILELVKYLNTSESTIRRDLIALDKAGLLKKVHGGATALKDISINTLDDIVENRKSLNMEEKFKIAKYAASLIKDNDLVYLDAGTTTELMINFINNTKAIFVTNGIVHARNLIKKNCTTYILGGELKLSTEAIVGAETVKSLRKYNFTKGFFGANGVDLERGFSTPDIKEAMVKEEALIRSKKRYVLCDKSKFDEISSITFADIQDAEIITTKLDNYKYRNKSEILEVDIL